MRTKLLVPVLVTGLLGASAATASSAGTATVRLKDNYFSPKTKTVSKNTRVTFRWAGRRAHNVVVTRGPVKFSSRTQVKGTYRKRFARRGRYTLVCTLHPGMTMKLRVR
jgi:plastocyanin